jgi:cobalt transporter subunit CbtB
MATMSVHPAPTSHPEAIRVPVWAWALTLVALFGLYLIANENGAVLSHAANYVHEFTHDGRHALGVPCH